MKENPLISKLNEFQRNYDIRLNKKERNNELDKLFMDLAKYLMYGGYFHCSERYDLYITSVEFYYHEENGEIKDPIMYHRNKKKWIKNLLLIQHTMNHIFQWLQYLKQCLQIPKKQKKFMKIILTIL